MSTYGSVSNTSKLGVFISYSRDDLLFADQLEAALIAMGHEPTMDRVGIKPGEKWADRLGNMIRDSDTVVFVVSPASNQSQNCGEEVDESLRMGKRIIPVACRPFEGTKPPEKLTTLNYIYFYADKAAPDSGFGRGIMKLKEALETDVEWLREHTRLLQRASEWNANKRTDNRLLTGDLIVAAKDWAVRRPSGAPEPTPVQLDFIQTSEKVETNSRNIERQRLAAMAAAQEERAKALEEAEKAQRREAAQTRIAAEAQATVLRRTRQGLAAAMVLAVAAVGAGGYAVYLQQISDRIAQNNEKLVAISLDSTGELVSTSIQWANERGVPLRESVQVVEKAAAMLQQVKQGADTPPKVQQRVASVLMALSLSYKELAQYIEEDKKASEAHQILKDLVAARPSDPDIQDDFARSLTVYAKGRHSSGHPEDAIDAYTSCLDLEAKYGADRVNADSSLLTTFSSCRRELAQLNFDRARQSLALEQLEAGLTLAVYAFALRPADANALHDVVWSYIERSDFHRLRGEPQAAIQDANKGLAIVETSRLNESLEKMAKNLVPVIYVERGDIRAKDKQWAEALADYQLAFQTDSDLANRDPTNATIRSRFILDLVKVAEMYAKLNQFDQAGQTFAKAADEAVNSIKTFPSLRTLRQDLAYVLSGQANLLEQGREFAKAAEKRELALPAEEAALAMEPSNIQLRRETAYFALQTGDSQSAARDYSGALKSYARASELYIKLIEDAPTQTSLRRTYAGALENKAKVQVAMSQPSPALATLEEARKNREFLLISTDPVGTQVSEAQRRRNLANTDDLIMGVAISVNDCERGKQAFTAAKDGLTRAIAEAWPTDKPIEWAQQLDSLQAFGSAVCAIGIPSGSNPISARGSDRRP